MPFPPAEEDEYDDALFLSEPGHIMLLDTDDEQSMSDSLSHDIDSDFAALAVNDRMDTIDSESENERDVNEYYKSSLVSNLVCQKDG